MSGDSSGSNILSVYAEHALEARREADIRTGRLNWMMAAQALLFGAFAQVVVEMGKNDNHGAHTSLLRDVARAVAAAGVTAAVAVWFGIWCANRAEQEAFRAYTMTFVRYVADTALTLRYAQAGGLPNEVDAWNKQLDVQLGRQPAAMPDPGSWPAQEEVPPLAQRQYGLAGPAAPPLLVANAQLLACAPRFAPMRKLLLAIEHDILSSTGAAQKWDRASHEANLGYLEKILCPYNSMCSNFLPCLFYALGFRLRFNFNQPPGMPVDDSLWPGPKGMDCDSLTQSKYSFCLDPGYIAHRLCCYGLLSGFIGAWGYLLARI